MFEAQMETNEPSEDSEGSLMEDRKTPSVRDWCKEVDASKNREKNYRQEAQDIVKLYEGDNEKRDQFNILYSNTETLAPAIYNSTPRPQVKRRFNDADPIAKAVSTLVQRVLEYQLDDGLQVYATFDSLMESATLQAIVPGRGVTRFVYEAEVVGEGETAQIVSEQVYGKHVPWDRFNHGYAKVWEDVPWVSFTWFMTREEIQRNFPGTAAKVSWEEISADSDEYRSLEDDKKGVPVCEVLEVWDKETKKVYFYTPHDKENYLREPQDDPYGLTGFFPCPKPLTLFNAISSLVPVPLYRMYKAQAEELNRVTVRIQKIVEAMKIRGFYDSTLTGIEALFSSEDNTMIPLDNVAGAIASSGSLDAALFFMPIEKLVGVLQQLYNQRQQIKAVIYEITGIADIMRGVSQASETLGAQQLKDQWGTLRLKRFQRRVALHVRNCLRIQAELCMTKLQPDTLKAITGLNYPTAEQKQQAQMMAQMMQQQGQAPDPASMQVLSQPSMEELVEVMHNDLQRSYRIDIETNSTLDAEATEDKQDIQELLTAIGQFFQAVGPLVQQGTLPFTVAKDMLLAVSRRYRLGSEFENALAAMQQPQPQPDPKEALTKLDMQFKEKENAHKERMMQMDAELRMAEHQMTLQELQQKGQLAAVTHQQKMQALVLQAQVQAAAPSKTARSTN